jgi:hypothetical protein
MKVCEELWRYSSTVLEFSTGIRQVLSFMPQPLYIKQKIPCACCTGGHCGIGRKYAHTGNQTATIQPVSQLLYRLSYPDSLHMQKKELK